MKYRYILAIDPSGSFNEGKGTTGWVLIDYTTKLLNRGIIKAEDYKCPEEYWDKHIELLRRYFNKFGKNLLVVMEDYILYRNRSINQTNSKMETCRLIGLMQWYCWKNLQPYSMQLAASVKNRWADDLLFREKIIQKQGKTTIERKSGHTLNSVHCRDAFRHALHYAITRNEDKQRKKSKKIKQRFKY